MRLSTTDRGRPHRRFFIGQCKSTSVPEPYVLARMDVHTSSYWQWRGLAETKSTKERQKAQVEMENAGTHVRRKHITTIAICANICEYRRQLRNMYVKVLSQHKCNKT